MVTLIALGIPGIFAGALITEQIFRVNGIGQYLIIAIQGGDLPTVQTVTFIFAVLVVLLQYRRRCALRHSRSARDLHLGNTLSMLADGHRQIP